MGMGDGEKKVTHFFTSKTYYSPVTKERHYEWQARECKNPAVQAKFGIPTYISYDTCRACKFSKLEQFTTGVVCCYEGSGLA